MGTKLSPIFQDAQLDANGNPAVGGKIFTYAAGSSSKLAAYQDEAGSVAHSNPIILNSRGEPPAPIRLSDQLEYKLVYAPAGDSDPPSSPIRTIDDVRGVNETQSASTPDEWLASGLSPTFLTSNSFSVPGNNTALIHPGRRIKLTLSASTRYGTVLSSDFSTVTTVVVQLDAGALDSTLSSISVGLASYTSTSIPSVLQMKRAGGRITTESLVPVSTSDRLTQTNIFYTPYDGDQIQIYTGSYWLNAQFSELQLVLDGDSLHTGYHQVDKNFDLFVFIDSGTLRLGTGPAWSSNTARGTGAGTTELELKNGTYTNKVSAVMRFGSASGNTVTVPANRGTYVGSFRATANGQTEDSLAKRFLFNASNREARNMRVLETTDSWTYTVLTFRQANNSAANKLSMLLGLPGVFAVAEINISVTNGSVGAGQAVAVGVDSTTTASADCVFSVAQTEASAQLRPISASYAGYPGLGYHELVWLEESQATGTTTWYGDNGAGLIQTRSAITGRVAM